jgi:hypothetical protein
MHIPSINNYSSKQVKNLEQNFAMIIPPPFIKYPIKHEFEISFITLHARPMYYANKIEIHLLKIIGR